MITVFGIVRVSFTFTFLFIHQGISLEAGHDADDIIITNTVSQARFSGLLIVKNVLDHILGKEEDRILLHPLVQTVKV